MNASSMSFRLLESLEKLGPCTADTAALAAGIAVSRRGAGFRIGALRKRGYVEQFPGGGPFEWQVTQKGREALADPNGDARRERERRLRWERELRRRKMRLLPSYPSPEHVERQKIMGVPEHLIFARFEPADRYRSGS